MVCCGFAVCSVADADDASQGAVVVAAVCDVTRRSVVLTVVRAVLAGVVYASGDVVLAVVRAVCVVVIICLVVVALAVVRDVVRAVVLAVVLDVVRAVVRAVVFAVVPVV